MISKGDFLLTIRKGNPSIREDDPLFEQYEEASEAAGKALAAMSGIGFVSMTKRYNAFVSVCRHLDAMHEQGSINGDGAQLAIIILRLSSTPFMKAAIAFDIQGPRLRALAQTELPNAARQYLAGIKR